MERASVAPSRGRGAAPSIESDCSGSGAPAAPSRPRRTGMSCGRFGASPPTSGVAGSACDSVSVYVCAAASYDVATVSVGVPACAPHRRPHALKSETQNSTIRSSSGPGQAARLRVPPLEGADVARARVRVHHRREKVVRRHRLPPPAPPLSAAPQGTAHSWRAQGPRTGAAMRCVRGRAGGVHAPGRRGAGSRGPCRAGSHRAPAASRTSGSPPLPSRTPYTCTHARPRTRPRLSPGPPTAMIGKRGWGKGLGK